MIAVKSSRRTPPDRTVSYQAGLETLSAAGRGEPLRTAFQASRRASTRVAVQRDARAEITEIRIGRWRVLKPHTGRRLAEVRETSGGRVAVRIERYDRQPAPATSEIWQLYDPCGRFEAALQSTPDGRFALLTNYETRQAVRLNRNSRGELEAVESWYF